MSRGKVQKEIAIIGMGFCGLMTAIHLIRNARSSLRLYLINDGYPFGKGVAYSTGLNEHLLNVPAARMSCFADEPLHFLDWVFLKKPFSKMDKEILGRTYLPRMVYGEYLLDVWKKTLKNKKALVSVEMLRKMAVDIVEVSGKHKVHFADASSVQADYVVLATGNDSPANPNIRNKVFFEGENYFQSPWNYEAMKGIGENENVLIIGNGLTMVDVVLQLAKNGCKGTIYSISPNGFNILPHRHNGMAYSKLVKELKRPYDINSLFRLFRKHVNFVRQFGLSAEPVIDSVRDYSQKIWLDLSIADKRRFLFHLRHLWGVARHRLPAHVYDLIQHMQTQKKLIILKGKILDIEESSREIKVHFIDKRKEEKTVISVSRAINCTGPLPDIAKSQNALLKNLVEKGAIRPDALRLGVETNLEGAIIQEDGKPSKTLFTLGNNLRGLLWESTAVPELRVQSEKLALALLKK